MKHVSSEMKGDFLDAVWKGHCDCEKWQENGMRKSQRSR